MQRERERGRAGEHHEVLDLEEEGAEIHRLRLGKRRERIGAVGKHDGHDFLELHPDREAGDHRGDGGALPDRPEAEPFDIDADENRAQHGGRGDREATGAELEEDQRADEGAQHDRRAVGQVEAAHDAEDQGEADGEEGVGGAQHHPVEAVLNEIDHRAGRIPPVNRSPATPDKPFGSTPPRRALPACRRRSRGPARAGRNDAPPEAPCGRSAPPGRSRFRRRAGRG